MKIIGCDLHARQQTLAMLETTTGEVVNVTLMHEGNAVREFYSQLPRPVLVCIEATGSMHWFVNLMEELGMGSDWMASDSRRMTGKPEVVGPDSQFLVCRLYILDQHTKRRKRKLAPPKGKCPVDRKSVV